MSGHTERRRDVAGSDLYMGTLDTLILKAVSWGPRHGYAIGRWIREQTDGVLQVNHRVHHPTNQFIPGIIGRVKKNHARWVEFPVRPESHDPRGPFPHAALFAFETGPDLLDGLVRPRIV